MSDQAAEIGRRLKTQYNRITADPIFLVQGPWLMRRSGLCSVC